MSGLDFWKKGTVLTVVMVSFILSVSLAHTRASLAASKGEATYVELLNSSPRLKQAHDELDEVYKSCRSVLNEDAKTRLKKEQIEWLKDRTRRLEQPGKNLKELESEILEFTNKRIAELRSLNASSSTSLPNSADPGVSEVQSDLSQAGGKGNFQASVKDMIQLIDQYQQLVGQRKFTEAIPLGEKALKIAQNLYGEKNVNTGTCYRYLAWAYHGMADYRKAESLYQKALSITQEARGNWPSEDTAECYYDLASFYVQRGDYSKAEPLTEKCLAIYKELKDGSDQVKADRYEQVGKLYKAMGREQKAKSLEQEVLALRNQFLAKKKQDEAKIKQIEASPAMKKADRELNETYKSCMAILNADAQGRLKNKQEEWIKQRARRVESDSRDIKVVETSILDDTNQRIAQLKALRSSPFQWMLKTSESPVLSVNPGNLPKDTLSVSVTPAGGLTVEAGSPINFSWTLNHAPVQPDKVYDFVVLSMPNTVRVNGEGFMVLPPQQDLPFGLKYNPDKFRVVFPLYLVHRNKTWNFVVRPLVAGRFDIEWSYLALDRKTKELVFSAEDPHRSASFEVLDAAPKIIVQDRMGGNAPKDIRISYSGAFELRTYENYFEIYQAATGRLILRKAGTQPVFSSTSRFLAYFASNRLVVLDLLNAEPISFPEGLTFSTVEVAWARGDASMTLGCSAWGGIDLLNPYLDSQKGITTMGEMCQCAACSAWANGLAFDRETSLVHIACNGWNEENKGPGLCDSPLGDLPAEVLGYGSCEAWSSYLNQLGLQMPMAPQEGWTFPGGLWFSHGAGAGDSSYATDAEGRELQPYSNVLDPEDKELQKNFLRPPKKASSPEGVLADIASSTSKTTYALDPDIAEEALANRLKDKGLFFPKNATMNYANTDEQKSDKVVLKANRILDKLYPKDDCFLRGITEYWQYSGGAHGASTLLRMSCDDGAPHSTGQEALILMDSQGGWIDLKKKLGDFIKSRPQDIRSNPLELSFEKYYGSGSDIHVFSSSNGILLISLIYTHKSDQTILLYDLRQNRFLSVITDVTEAYNLQSLRLSQDGRYVLQVNKDGPFFIYDAHKSKRILNGVYVDDEWVLYTNEGFYDSTTEGAHFVSWYFSGLQEHFDFNQFEAAYKKPELIKGILSGGSPNLPSVKPAPPPRITLASDATFTETTEKSYALNASASAEDSIQNVRIFVNGEPVREIPVGTKSGQISTEVPLLAGLNRISVIAYNEKGFSSNLKYVDVLCKNEEASRPDLHVLTVGISQYPKLPKEWQLSYAHTDARNLADAFKAQKGKLFGNVYTKTLPNDEANPASITAELKALEKVAEKDLVVIMLAGHGIRSKDGTFYFLTPTGDIANPENGDGALSWETLGQYIEKIRGRVVLLLDACHSGGISTETIVPNDDLAKKFFAMGKGGVMILAASKGRQASLESPDLGGGFGVFTYGIVQALGTKAAAADLDGNGFVEWLELVSNVSAFVHNETKGEQTPWLARSEIFGDFPMAVGQRRLAKKAEFPVRLPPPYMGRQLAASESSPPVSSKEVPVLDDAIPTAPNNQEKWQALTPLPPKDLPNGRQQTANLASPPKQAEPVDGAVAKTRPPLPPAQPNESSDDLSRISATVRSYFSSVEKKNIDQAIGFYAASKQAKIKRNVLEATAKQTEYYKVDKIEPLSIGNLNAKVKVFLAHKKLNAPVEYWEGDFEFVKEGGEWRIVNTPGKRVR